MEKIKILFLHNDILLYSSISKAFENNTKFELYESELGDGKFLDYLRVGNLNIISIIVKRIDTFLINEIAHVRKNFKNIKIVLITSDSSSENIGVISQFGCTGLIDHNCKISILESIFVEITAGESAFYFNEEKLTISDFEKEKSLQKRFIKTKNCSENQITYRESQILNLIAEGYTSKEIGGILGLSVRTIEGYRSSIMSKFNLKSYTHLVTFAICNVLFCNKKCQ